MVASVAAAGNLAHRHAAELDPRFGLEVLHLADADHDQAGHVEPAGRHDVEGRSVLALEPLGLRRPLDQIAGRLEHRAGGRPELEPVVAEHNENALGASRKRHEIELQGGGHRRPFAVPRRARNGLGFGASWCGRPATDMARPVRAVPSPLKNGPRSHVGKLTIVAPATHPLTLHFVVHAQWLCLGEAILLDDQFHRAKVGRSTTHNAITGMGARRRERLSRKRGRHARMGSIGRYIFRATLGAFLVVLVSVTALMWITQALRNFDLMTNQGQSILVFVGITGLIIPMLVMIIAPIALMIAVAPCADQARQRFRTDRHERRRHGALARVPAVPRTSASWSRWSWPGSASISRRCACRSCAAGRRRCAPKS